MQPWDLMGDPRHKRPYPEGDRTEMTPEWKQLVKDTLAANKLAGAGIQDQAELADAIGVTKSAITKMFKAHASKLVRPISVALCIPMPSEAAEGASEWARMRELPPKERGKLLAIIRNFLG